jgi:hypothetical protein
MDTLPWWNEALAFKLKHSLRLMSLLIAIAMFALIVMPRIFHITEITELRHRSAISIRCKLDNIG